VIVRAQALGLQQKIISYTGEQPSRRWAPHQ